MTHSHIHPKMRYTYVGIDSHKDTHTAVFLDCFYDKLGEITFGSATSGFDEFIKMAEKSSLPNTELAFGLEDISVYGRTLAQSLLENNYLVKHCDASLVASERNAKNILHKTDSVDAECCARVLINRFDKLPLATSGDKFWILSNLVARRNAMSKIHSISKNQLHNTIHENYPSYKSFFYKIDAVSSLAFFEAYPSPVSLKDVTPEQLAITLAQASRNQGLKKAKKILDAVKTDGFNTSPYQSIRDFTIQSMVRQIKTSQAELALIDEHIKDFLSHFDYDLTQIKGIDTLTMAKFIVEIGDISRFKNAKALAKYSGVAPVIHSSGTGSVHYANSGGNRNLNELFYRLAMMQALPRSKEQHLMNPLFHEYYQKKLSEGKTKRQALKCVQRRLVNIIFNMMKHGQSYVNPPMGKFKPKTDDTSA